MSRVAMLLIAILASVGAARTETTDKPTIDQWGHKSPYSQELEDQSTARFGRGNVGAELDRQQWMANHEQQAIENKINNRSKPAGLPRGQSLGRSTSSR
jgi:hypothetical protein